MSNTQRCSECSGTKKVMGLGLMIRDCPACDGIGWVKMDVEMIKDDLAAEPVKKRKGRPPKNVEANTSD